MKTITEILKSLGVKATEVQIGELEKLLAAKKEPTSDKKYKVAKREFAAKTPLQMKQAVLCVGDEETVTMAEWSQKLGTYEGFATKQPVERIIGFYRKRMLDEGLVVEA